MHEEQRQAIPARLEPEPLLAHVARAEVDLARAQASSELPPSLGSATFSSSFLWNVADISIDLFLSILIVFLSRKSLAPTTSVTIRAIETSAIETARRRTSCAMAKRKTRPTVTKLKTMPWR